jgi:hypothetical protein
LLIGFGLFHDELTGAKRIAMGREVSAGSAPDATLLMTACSRRRQRRPLHRSLRWTLRSPSSGG